MGQAVLPPGFRFYPTDQELVMHYLERKARGEDSKVDIIAEIDLYKHEPWDLPEKSYLCTKDSNWYFFNVRDNKYSHGSRTNRATKAGYWKATGNDRKVCRGSQTVGMKKTLVFYLGRAPKGERTDWIMHEFRLDEEYEKHKKIYCAVVLCRIHKRSGVGSRDGEQCSAQVLDGHDEKITPAEGILTNSIAQNCPWLDSDEAQQEQVMSATIPQASHCIEELNSGEEMQSLLQSFFPCERQDGDLGIPPVNQLGLDDLHDILHPAREEVEILEDVLQTIIGPDQGAPSMDTSLDKYDLQTLEAFAYSGDAVGGDYLELADLDHPLEDFFLQFLPHEDQLCPLAEEDTGIDIRPRTRLAQEGLLGQGTAARRARLQIPALQLTPSTDGSIDNEDTLQHGEDSHNGHGQSLLPEVMKNGDLTNVLSIEPQDAVIIYRRHNGEDGVTDFFPGFGIAESSPSQSQDIKSRRKMEGSSLHVVSEIKEVITKPLQAVDFTSEDLLLENDASSVNMVKTSSSLSCAYISDSDAADIIDASSVKQTSSEVQIIANTFSMDLPLSRDLAGRDSLVSNRIFLSGLHCSGLELADINMESLVLDAISNIDSQRSSTSRNIWAGQINPVGSAAFIDKDGNVTKAMKQDVKLELLSTPDQNHGRLASMLTGHVLPIEQTANCIESIRSPPLSNSNPINAVDVLETAASISSLSASSSHGFQKSLLRIIKLLDNVPASPASADELPLDMSQCNSVYKKALASELILKSGSKVVAAGDAEAVVTCCCLKEETEHLQAVLPARCCLKLITADLICRVPSGPLLGAKILRETPQIQTKCCLSMFSKCKTPCLGESLTPIFFAKVREQLCKSLREGFKIITFGGSTSALLIFCILWGFWWRLTKSALITIFNQNCIFPVI